MKKKVASVIWTDEEDALICRMRRKGAEPREIAEELPHRTADAVRRRSAILLKRGRFTSLRRRWTAEEDAVIRELRAKGCGDAEIAAQLRDRTKDAVGGRVQQLRVTGALDGHPVVPKPRRPWTDREESIVIRMRSRDAKIHEIAKRLPRRTARAVQDRVQQLLAHEEVERITSGPRSYRPWSPEEDLLLETMRAAKMTTREIANALGRCSQSVTGHIAYQSRKGELRTVRAGKKKGAAP